MTIKETVEGPTRYPLEKPLPGAINVIPLPEGNIVVNGQRFSHVDGEVPKVTLAINDTYCLVGEVALEGQEMVVIQEASAYGGGKVVSNGYYLVPHAAWLVSTGQGR